MAEQTKIDREDLLKKLNISEEELLFYEQELELAGNSDDNAINTFTDEELKLIQFFHKLRASGLSNNEIKVLSSVSEILKSTDIEHSDEIKNILALSPTYRLKQSLNIARQELTSLRSRVHELEKTLEDLLNSDSEISNMAMLQKELEVKQKTLDSMDRRLADAISQKKQLEALLAAYKEGATPLKIKGKKAKELYEALIKKETELEETKKRNEELSVKSEDNLAEAEELREIIDEMEEEFRARGEEIEEQYKEQISTLKKQIEELIDRKQKEWEAYYLKSSDQHRKELLTLQRKHEHQSLRLRQKIKELEEELDDLKTRQNPLFALLKVGSKLR
ncbi:MAG: hypothetical protein HYZ79_03990 [Candidatus Melainabacteria bacterium]|nr:hypothetical protein [Candidatus Melainabacteria bacterium]